MSVGRSASGCIFQLFFSSWARTKLSIGVRTWSLVATVGTGYFTGFLNDHQLRSFGVILASSLARICSSVSGGATGKRPYWMYDFINCFSATVNLPPCGIVSFSISFHIRLRSGLPGAITGPLELPSIMPAKELRSSLAIFCFGPWHPTQFFSRTGSISVLKSGSRCPNAGIAIALTTRPIRSKLDDITVLLPRQRIPVLGLVNHFLPVRCKFQGACSGLLRILTYTFQRNLFL